MIEAYLMLFWLGVLLLLGIALAVMIVYAVIDALIKRHRNTNA